MSTKLCATAVALLAATGQAMAGGYQVSLQGQKQIGMGHTGTALAWDASSIFFNPGSLGFLKKNSILGGASFITSTVAFVGPAGQSYKTETKNPLATPFAVYGVYLVGKEKRLAVGAAAYTPYGSTVNWGSSWKGIDQLEELSLKAIYTNVSLAYRLHEKISIGGGFNYVFGSVDLRQGISQINTDGSGYGMARLKGDASGIGYNAGVHIKATEKFSIGLSYRHQVVMKISGGDATVATSSVALDGSKFPKSGATKFNASLPLPSVASIGLGYKATDKLTLAVDVNYTFWDAYKALSFTFDSSFGGALVKSSPRNYKNAVAYRLGANYEVSELLSLRAGGYFDQTPVQAGYMTAETPDANRFGASVGVSIRPIKNLFVDASLLMIFGQKRTQTDADMVSAGTNAGVTPGAAAAVQPGTYQQRAFIPGIQVGYEF